MTGKIHWAHKLGREESPGPGAYNIPSCFGNTSPRFSIKKRYPEKLKESNADFYNIRKIDDAPHFTIRPRTGDMIKDNGIPGPSYVPPPFGSGGTRHNTVRKHTNPRKRRYESYNTSIQGPAGYDTTIRNTRYAYIGSKESPGWIHLTDNPSPDTYSPKRDLTEPSSPRYSMRASPKIKRDVEGPGPGGFNIRGDFANKAQSIHIKHKVYDTNETPGPGQYEIAGKTGKDARSATISPRYSKKEKYDDIPLLQLPSIFNKRNSITIGKRNEVTTKDFLPGPGDYKVNPIRNKQSYVIEPKLTQDDIDKMKSIKDKMPYIEEEPGPGTYSPNFNSVYNSPSFSFGEKTEHDAAFNVKDDGKPGPDYIPEIISFSHKYTIKGRNFIKEKACATENADFNGFLEPSKGHAFTIGRKDTIDLIPK